MSEFEDDRRELLDDLARSRARLSAVVGALQPEHLQRARRGSWTVARILEHVLYSDRLYTQMIAIFTGRAADVRDITPVTAPAEAVAALDSSCEAFRAAIADVPEADFYRLQTIGHEEYSVLSILENSAAHDREHTEQVRRTVAS
jgi:uncharacterized damage-inducible protein DinB